MYPFSIYFMQTVKNFPGLNKLQKKVFHVQQEKCPHYLVQVDYIEVDIRVLGSAAESFATMF